MGMTETRQAPETLAELAQGLLELANHLERVTEGLEAKDSAQIADRMLKDGADEYQAAFHGITYAWVLAIMPELEPIVSLDAKDYRRTVVLERRDGSVRDDTYQHLRFEFMLPKSLDYVDDSWAGREVEA